MTSLEAYESFNTASQYSRPIQHAKQDISVNTDAYTYYSFLNQDNMKLQILIRNKSASHDVVLEIRANPERSTSAPAYSTTDDLANWLIIEQPDGALEATIENGDWYNETLTDYYAWILIGLKRKTSGNSADVTIWRTSGP